MRLLNNKRGLEFETLIGILIMIIAFGFILYVFAVKTAQVDEKTSEILCRGFNALRSSAEIKIPVLEKEVGTPRACNTIYNIGKKSIPSEEYIKMGKGNAKEATAYEIRDMIARCWWMWLDGRENDMFRKGVGESKQTGFICYTFTIRENVKGKRIGEISLSDMDKPLSESYYAIDNTDRCGFNGGGKCLERCEASAEPDSFSKEVNSDRCIPINNKPQKCCVVRDDNYECVDKGGECYRGACNEIKEGGTWLEFNRWKCPGYSPEGGGMRCCVNKRSMVSYYDYIQGTEGSDTGPGVLMYMIDEDVLRRDIVYAITFISPGRNFNWNTALAFGEVVAAGVATAISVKMTIVTGGITTPLTVGLAGLTAALNERFKHSGGANNINYIVVSKYDNVKGKYAESTGKGND